MHARAHLCLSAQWRKRSRRASTMIMAICPGCSFSFPSFFFPYQWKIRRLKTTIPLPSLLSFYFCLISASRPGSIRRASQKRSIVTRRSVNEETPGPYRAVRDIAIISSSKCRATQFCIMLAKFMRGERSEPKLSGPLLPPVPS